jgi:hypothetical protein
MDKIFKTWMINKIKEIAKENRLPVDTDVVIKIVDGDAVKTKYEMDFVEGGNGERYSFIPDKEIWIDGNIDSSQHFPIILHEMIERTLMKHMGLSYDEAHEICNAVEKKVRKS